MPPPPGTATWNRPANPATSGIMARRDIAAPYGPPRRQQSEQSGCAFASAAAVPATAPAAGVKDRREPDRAADRAQQGDQSQAQNPGGAGRRWTAVSSSRGAPRHP